MQHGLWLGFLVSICHSFDMALRGTATETEFSGHGGHPEIKDV